MKRVCLILASGVGRRFGGPKALVDWDGVPLAVAHARARSADCDRAIVVTRADTAAVLSRRDPGLKIVISGEPDELGPAGSIAAAVKAGVIADADQVLVTPVDVPPASGEVVRALWGALDHAQAARPVMNGKPGHPVACLRAVVEGYREHPRPLRDVLEALGSSCAAVKVQSEEVLVDFDTPEDFSRWTGHDPTLGG
jgi:molybdenum cofactor cytidylyltransferase